VIGATADTNVFISALNFGGLPRQLLVAAQHKRFLLSTSPPIMAEMHRVLRDKFLWTEDMLKREALHLSRIATLVHPTQAIDAVPDDPDDNRILECAVEATSAYIVTGDNDLLRLGTYRSIRIVRVADFLKLLTP
jgi:putative PIN family toxin of toxin-antitoxin system